MRSAIVAELSVLSEEEHKKVDDYCREICKAMEARDYTMVEALFLVTILLRIVNKSFIETVTYAAAQEDDATEFLREAAEKNGASGSEAILKYTEEAALMQLGAWLGWVLDMSRTEKTADAKELLDA